MMKIREICILIACLMVVVAASLMLCRSAFPNQDGVRKMIISNYNYMILRHPAYVMSESIKPDDDISRGVDCSRMVYLVHKWAGLPVRRIVAKDMAMGFGGWTGKDVDIKDADELDLLWWSWLNMPHRPLGHVGAVLMHKGGVLGVVHSSETRKGPVHDEFKGVLVRDLKKVRRLDIYK